MAVAIPSILCGQPLAFVQNDQLWVKPADGPALAVVETGNPHAPAFSADGKWIAFLDGDRLGIVPTAGGEIQRPLGGGQVGDFRWRGAGAVLAVSTDDSVYVVSPEGEWKPVRVFAGEPESVRFSPDGKQIAISSIESDSDGTPARGHIEIVAADASTPSIRLLSGGPFEQLIVAAWSEGTIVFWKGEFSGSAFTDGFEIYTIPAGGGEAKKLGGPTLVYDELFAMSPDGSKIVLTNGEGRLAWTQKQIAVADLASGKLMALTNSKMAALFPAWSPDGERIAFSASADAGDVWGGETAKHALDQRRIWIMDADGSNQRQLTSDSDIRDERPVWSDDGKSIFFYRFDRDNQAGVWSIKVSGDETKLIAPLTLHKQEDWFGVYGYFNWDDHSGIYRTMSAK